MHAIATLIMNGNSYVAGAVALCKSIRMHMNQYHMHVICMVTSDVTDRQPLEELYDRVIEVPKIHIGEHPDMPEKSREIYHWISDACTKWNILGFTEYEKVLFMDSDMIVMHDIMCLFDIDTPASVFDSYQSKEMLSHPSFTGWRSHDGVCGGFTNWYKVALGLEQPPPNDFRVNGKILHIPHGASIPRHALDGLRLHASSNLAPSGGLVLLEPMEGMLQQFIDYIPHIMLSLSNHRIILSGIDEIGIALFMHDRGYTWHHISMEYNVFAYHVYNIFRDRCKVLHYGGQYKPWIKNKITGLSELETIQMHIDRGKTQYIPMHEVTKLWWSIYEG